jgi:hypothetical protein
VLAVLLLAVAVTAPIAVIEPPVDPGYVDSLVDLGLLGWLVISILALVLGYVPTKGRLEDEKANNARYVAAIEKDRDEWKAIAKDAVSGLDRIGDILAERKS